MGKIICFISDEFADFEITLALHKIRNVGKKEVLTVAYSDKAIVSESGLTYRPDLIFHEAMALNDIEGLLIPGGPIRNQQQELTDFIIKLDQEGKMIAAICNGPQYLGRAGLLHHRRFTTSCSVESINQLHVEDPFPRDNYVDKRVVRDGHVLTAKGRAFVDFSFEIFDYLGIYANANEKRELFRDIMDR
ncbi:DJ-1/PfpI family protein [Paenibacillus sp. CGMCC 1.16610]|uniref:Thiamine biosynthesis protein ThiJ n=1 Tax=Paenibacillus anseongense TaxID=2682845 RepID=A0ABW9UI76_9BACL|nr:MULTISPECIES: DJ-1/PfpI family protein [Paenibacillus]MBA2943669.1 DJ-1/PfpI family protein [Paenibacillus sp. CGMCC 1.16610]MVQ37575.1 thiamine biosynthesis protein ThiJ [Paenibacillus anseongense]